MKPEIDENNENFKQFMECFLRGASQQDIYSDANAGFAQRPGGELDEVTLKRRQVTGRIQFKRIYEHLNNIVEPIDRHIGVAGKRALDFGCGTGALSVALALKGAQVVAVDPTPISLEAGLWRARYFDQEDRVTWKLVDPQPGLAFPDASFDLITVNSVMEFIPGSRDSYVLDLLRLLKPGGHLVISTQNGLFPVDYYTGAYFPLFRRRTMIERQVPYGMTYFELLRWIKRSPRRVENLCKRNYFNSIDKLTARKRREGKSGTARMLEVPNALAKGVCRLAGIPSDIFFPYATYLFRAVD